MRISRLSAGLIALLLVWLLLAGARAAPAEVPEKANISAENRSGAGEQILPVMSGIPGPRTTSEARDWYERGFALTGEERYPEALQAYEKALSYNRSLLNAWYYAGDALFHMGRYEEALLVLGNATAMDPDFVDAYFYEGRIYERLGRTRDKEIALERGLQAAERVKAKEGTENPGTGTPGGLPVPMSPITAFLGSGIAMGFRLYWKGES